MIEMLVLGAIGLAVALVVGLVASVFGFVLWLLFLPFKLLGWIFKGVAMLALTPFLLVGGLVAAIAMGAMFFVLALPALPLIGFIALLAWLARRGRPRGATA